MDERYDRLLVRRRLLMEALAGPLGSVERAECTATLDRLEQEIADDLRARLQRAGFKHTERSST